MQTAVIERRRARPVQRHYCVQDSHVHLVCEGNDRVALWRGIQRLAVRLARAINRRAGRRAPPPDPRARGEAPVGRPRSWLLREGWRRGRGGLVDRYEVPGYG
ncbi:MAG: hypothetical protein AABZ30_16135 [Myxococcota bacterium]